MTTSALTPRVSTLLDWIEDQAKELDSSNIQAAVAELRERLGGDGEREFEVGWAIPVTASDPISAALTARGIHLDEGNIATIYTVTDLTHAMRYMVDLNPDNNGSALIVRQESLT